jgi:hypothetical protein
MMHPSDLYQIEVSYYVDKANIQLFIHVPMALTSLMQSICKFHPFPLPFTDTHFLLPGPEDTLLTLSSGLDHCSAEMNHAALVDCQKASSIYLCKNILHPRLNATFLSAL